jgi:hypothetical protein
MQVFAYLLARLSEPSSYAGLGAILGLVGWHLSDTELGTIIQFLAAGCALAALFLKERGIIAAIALACLLAPVLSACSGLAGAGASLGVVAGGITIADNVSAAVDPVIQTACAEYQKGKAAADAVIGAGLLPSNITGKVASIESFGDAACANPPQGDALSTAIWLGQLVGQIMTLTTSTKQSG